MTHCAHTRRSTSLVRGALVHAAAMVVALALTGSAHAQTHGAPSRAHAFPQHTKRVSVTAGTGFSSNETYLILGAGVGYYLVDGLELAVDTDFWLIGSPQVWNLAPGLRYILDTRTRFLPYVGSFYRHSFVVDYEDLDSIGARAGLLLLLSPNAAGSLGLVYERTLDCDESFFRSCDFLYPEVMFLLHF